MEERYAKQGQLIGPVFEAAVEDWDHHIGKITDFWSGVMLRTAARWPSRMRAWSASPRR